MVDFHQRVWYTQGSIDGEQAMGHISGVINSYLQGMAAYYASDTKSNPYPQDSQDAMAWDAGWGKAWDKAVAAEVEVEHRLVIAQRLSDPTRGYCRRKR